MTQPVPYLSPYVLQHSISASHKTEKMQVGMCSVMVGATKIKLGATMPPGPHLAMAEEKAAPGRLLLMIG